MSAVALANKSVAYEQYLVLEGVFVQVCPSSWPCTHTAAFSAASVPLLEIWHLPIWLSLPVQVSLTCGHLCCDSGSSLLHCSL